MAGFLSMLTGGSEPIIESIIIYQHNHFKLINGKKQLVV